MKLVIFDFDGTLVATQSIDARLFIAAADCPSSWVCQLNLSRPAETLSQSGLRNHRHGLPFRHRLVAEISKCASRDEMALDVKQIVDRTVN